MFAPMVRWRFGVYRYHVRQWGHLLKSVTADIRRASLWSVDVPIGRRQFGIHSSKFMIVMRVTPMRH
jgi:hypothetical protein